MIEQLFGSKTRVKLLQLFYANPNRSFYVREITRKVEEQINSVRRELANLQSIGIITSDTSNNKVYYEVDQKYENYEPLRQLFGGKTVRTKRTTKAVKENMTEEVVEAPSELRELGNIDAVCLLGQFTRDEISGVDVLVIGNVNHNALQKYIADLEDKEGKELRYSVFSLDDFTYRLAIKDRFASNVLLSKKQILVDRAGILS